MINIEFLTSGKSYSSQTIIDKLKNIEKEINKKIEINSKIRRIKYLKMSNGMKELLN